MNKMRTPTLLATMAGLFGGCSAGDKTDYSNNAAGAAKAAGNNSVIHAIDTVAMPT